ncbi:MAG: FecR family protein [Cyclobacteriaceae bacterium]
MDIKILHMFERFVKGQASEEEREQMLHWLSDENNKIEAYHLMQAKWFETQTDQLMSDEIDYKQAWKKIESQISHNNLNTAQSTNASSVRKIRLNRPWILHSMTKMAASLAIFLGFAFLVHFYIQNTNKIGVNEVDLSTQIVVKSTESKQRLSFVLGDGTKVTLNANSSLQFPKRFSNTSREVELVGEAYFEVAQNIQQPFIVKTGNIYTKALGTSFNIKHKSGDSDIRVSLTSGKVSVGQAVEEDLENEKLKILNPGEEVLYNVETHEMKKGYFKARTVTAWKDGILLFDEMNVHQIVRALEEWYDVKITLKNPPSLNWKYTGEFQKEPLKNVLDGLSFSKKLSYEIDNNHVIVNFKD